MIFYKLVSIWTNNNKLFIIFCFVFIRTMRKTAFDSKNNEEILENENYLRKMTKLLSSIKNV